MPKYDININLTDKTKAGGPTRASKDQKLDLKPIANALDKALKNSLKPVVTQLKELSGNIRKDSPQKKDTTLAKNIATELEKVFNRSLTKLTKQIATTATKPQTTTKTQVKSNDVIIAKALKSFENTLNASIGKIGATKGIKVDSDAIAKAVSSAVKNALPKNTGKLVAEVTNLSKELDDLGKGVTNLSRNLSGNKKDINIDKLLSEFRNIAGILKKLPQAAGQTTATAKSVLSSDKLAASITKDFNAGVDKLAKAARDKAEIAIEVNKDKLTKSVTEALMKAQKEFFGADFIDEKRIAAEIQKGVDKAARYTEKKMSDAVIKGASKAKIKGTESEHTIHFKGKGSKKEDLSKKIAGYKKELDRLSDIELTVNTAGVSTIIDKLQKDLSGIEETKTIPVDFDVDLSNLKKEVEDSTKQAFGFFDKRILSLKKQISEGLKLDEVKTDPGMAKALNASIKVLKDTVKEYEKLSKLVDKYPGVAGGKAPTVGKIRQRGVKVPDVKVDTAALTKGIEKDLENFAANINVIVGKTQADINKLAQSAAPSKHHDKMQKALDGFIKAAQDFDINKLRERSVSGFKGDVTERDVKMPSGTGFKPLRKQIESLETVYGSKQGIKKAVKGVEGGLQKWEEDLGRLSGLSIREARQQTEAAKVNKEALTVQKRLTSIREKQADIEEKALSQTVTPRTTASRPKSTGTAAKDIPIDIKSFVASMKTPILKREKAVVIPPLQGEEITTTVKDISFKDPAKIESAIKNQIDKNATALGKSLYNLQDYIVKQFEEEFKNTSKGWDIVRETAQSPAFELLPGERQSSMQIANVKAIKGELRKKGKATSAEASAKEVVDMFVEAFIEERVAGVDEEALLRDIGTWLKSITVDTLEGWSGISDTLKSSLKDIKSKASEGIAVSDKTIEELKTTLISSMTTDIQDTYGKTFGKVAAKKSLQEREFLRSIALPAAKLTETGATTFETVHGSQRSLSKFATYKSGFEVIFDDLEKAAKAEFAEQIRAFEGITPTKAPAVEVKSLSERLLKTASKGDLGYIKERYQEAAPYTRAEALGKEATPEALQMFESEVNKSLESLSTVDDVIKTMADKFNLTAFNVVKALDTIKFENVYDVYKKVLEVPGSPLEKLTKTPQFSSSIRNYEKAIRQVEQIMPILEGSRPRRAAYQENVVNVTSRTSPLFAGEGLGPNAEVQKTFIKDLNVRIKEVLDVNKILKQAGRPGLPIETLSSLGLTEAQAGARIQYSTGKVPEELQKDFSEGINYLKALPGVGIKMFAEDLKSLAPFGEQFQQVGRNISNVSNAMTSSLKSISRMPGKPIIGGIEAEMPKLRTAKEEQLIKSGVYGSQGYGFNVLAEMRQTAGTFEDQVLISGKLAGALTEAVKKLIKPSPAGLITEGVPSKSGASISNIQEGLVKDINKVAKAYQEIFGAPQVYEGGADKALIEDVKKTISIVRSQDVELQAAKLAEVFVSHFGRKITTRYGSKGVGITAAQGASKTDILSILETFGQEKGRIKVLGKEEREKAGLGTAIIPKSIGQLVVDLIQKTGLEHANTKELEDNLIKSGNKFILDIFKDAGKGLVTEEEAEKQQAIFKKTTAVLNALYGIDLASDIKGIAMLKSRYKEELGEMAKLYEEKPIDVRISAHGIAKRGLQTEVLEAVTSNIAATGAGGSTVLQQQVDYERLLGKGGEAGALSRYGQELGYTKAYGKDVDFATFEKNIIEKFTAGIDKQKDPEKFKEETEFAKRAAQLEKLSSFYVDIVDEFGKKRKSLVGEKFVQIIEEPGRFAEWSPQQIAEGMKGLKLNLPAFAAYSTIFGEGSSFMKDLQERSFLEDKKQWEYINALRIALGKNQEVAAKILSTLPTVQSSDIKTFEARTGSFAKSSPLEKQLKGTIADIDKFSSAFKLVLPTSEPGKTEDFYVPGPLTRESYEDPLIAGEYALSNLARRLQTLVNIANEVTAVREHPEDDATKEEITKALVGKIDEMMKKTTGKAQTKYINDLVSLLSTEKGSLAAPYYAPGIAEKGLRGFGEDLYGDVTALSQVDYVEFIAKKPEADNKKIVGAIKDLLVGPKEEAAGSKFKERSEARRQVETTLDKALKGDTDISLQNVLDIVKVENIGEAKLNKKLASLDKAKRAYYEELKQLVIGKSGAIGKTIFTKKVPSIMAKAVTAVVDKTEEIDVFGSHMAELAMEFDDLKGIVDAGKLGDIATAMAEVGKIHSESISKYKTDLKIPVLKQHELAIPPEMAKSLKVSFTKRYGAMGDILEEARQIDGTLYDLLTYVEALEKDITGDMSKSIDIKAQTSPTETASTDTIKKYIEDELAPYIESVRFPFTGTSSVQPYRAKLATYGDPGKRALAVPGVPEMPADTFKLFNEQIKKAQGMRDVAMTSREEAWGTGDVDKVQRLTEFIDLLNKAISDIIPKYIAHQQKLDFDGDSIQVHTAQNIQSRKEIKQHYDILMKDVDSTAAVFRDAFTAGAIQAPTGEYVLADMMKSFEKKFPTEKGFDFLKKPFLTEELEYLSGEEQLKILAQGAKQKGTASPVASVIKQVATTTITDKNELAQIGEVVAKIVGESSDDLAKTSAMAAKHLDTLDDSIKNIIYSSIKATLFQEKYKEAIEAQLFKIHTGPETESLTRLQRILETKIGTGGGLIRQTKAFDPVRERTVQMNEFLRFALQKGMDVKHAGGATVAKEIVSAIGGTRQNLSEFISKIKSEDQPDYSEVRDFIKANTMAIENFLGKKPTEEIRTLVSKISDRRDIATIGRPKLKEEYVSKMGIEGLLKELQDQVYDQAAKGLMKKGKAATMEQALGRVETLSAKKGGLKINELITEVFDKLYSYRTFTGAGALAGADPSDVAKKLEKDLNTALTATEARFGAYSEMVRASITQVKDQHAELLKVAADLQKYEPTSNLASILEKITSGKVAEKFGIGAAWTDEDIDKIRNKVDYYTKLAGIPSIPKYKKAEIELEAETLVRPLAETKIDKGVLSDADYTQEINKFAKSYINKIEALYQIDKAISVIKQRAKTTESISGLYRAGIAKETISPRPMRGGPKSVFRVEDVKISAGPPAGGAGAPAFGVPEGGPVPVYLVGIAPDIGITDIKEYVAKAGLGTRPTSLHEDPVFINELRDIATELSGGVNELKGATFEKIFRASGLSAGGEFGKPISPESQKRSMMDIMTGKQTTTKLLDATALLGTGLHEEIEEAMKKQYGAGNVITEQLVNLNDRIAGIITGHIDAVIKNTAGEQTVVDIKTVKPKLEQRLKKLTDKLGTTDFSVLQQELSKSKSTLDRDILKKLEDTASQVNFYMKALGGNVAAEAHLYDRFGDLADPAKVRFTYDPNRFKKDMLAIVEARKSVLESGEAFAETASLDELKQAAEKAASTTVSKAQVKKLIEGSKAYYEAMAKAREYSAQAVPRSEKFGIPSSYMKIAEDEARRRSTGQQQRTNIHPQAATKVYVGGPSATLMNLQRLHQRAKGAQRDVGIDKYSLAKLPEEVRKGISSAADIGPEYEKFINTLDMLKQEGKIDDSQIFKAWRQYKMSVGDYMLSEAKKAEATLKIAETTGDEGAIEDAYSIFEESIQKMQGFVKKGLGKRSDIYTRDKRYHDPEYAKAAGVFMSPEEITKKAATPLLPDEKLFKLYASLVKDLKPTAEGLSINMTPAIDKAREAISELSNMDMELVKLMEDAELMKRIGPEITDAWDFDALVKDISKLREALEYFARYNVSDDSMVSQRKNVENLIKYLKNAESLYTPFATDRKENLTGTKADYGITGAAKVPKWLDPSQQVAMHKKNIEAYKEYFERVEEAGGPQIGRRMTYVEKVFDEAGNTIRNVAHDFRKYGETVNSAGEKISLFSKGHRDLVSIMQGSERSFSAAIMRAVRWGAASQIVYGGFSQLKQAVGTMADIETGLAQLRMVMNDTTTDFDMLSDAAIGFAKQYGVGVTDVLKSMRIFAQQGLNQAEVIERTRTSTLAANVTTLSAKDATEALTAAMKVFGQEADSSMRYLDAWSEVEARHAITAGDMADAIKKSAAAAKNAGFTFDQLNGIVAAVGSVTRQTGKEVGTSMRFIMRRLSSEKGPKELGKLGIPVMTETGELRKGFEILGDLNKSWRDLTTAQKMSTAQAIGGTRQYNALLVMMDNWDEALQATRDSMNSKGSAERRNLELMKTYEKQLEQTRATATELQMSFGKLVLPTFKTALQTVRTFLDTINNIPEPIKAAGAFAVALITYLAKGSEIIDAMRNKFGQGQSLFGNVLGDISSELKATRYEVFGDSLDKFLGPQLKKDIAGLKSLSKKAISEGTDYTVGPEGTAKVGPLLSQSGKSIDDFTSTAGKALFIMNEWGMEFNKLLGDIATGTVEGFGTAGDALEKFSKKIGPLGNVAMLGLSQLTQGNFLDDIAAGLVTAADLSAGAAAKIFKAVERNLGPAAAKLIEKYASENTNLVRAIAPLATFMLGIYKVSDKLYSGYVRTTKSAQDYAKSQYGIKRAYEDQLKSLRTLSGDYDNLQNKLEDIQKVSRPDVKVRRQELGTYESPLLSMGKLYKNAISTTNQLASTNIGLVAGYDKLGNAILKSTGSLKEFISTAEKSRIKDIAQTDIDVAAKFVEDLTQIEGPEKWKSELKLILKEIPLVGEMMAKGIKIGPAKALDLLSDKLNKLLAARAKTPLSTAFDKDIKKYQESLKVVRTEFNATYSDFRKLLSNIPTTGLGRKEISNIFGAAELQKGYQLIVDVEPVLNTKALKGKVKWQDVLGSEVLRRVYPQLAGTLDVTGALTKARLETAGAVAREGKLVENDLVMFMDNIADKYDIAGNQAIVSLKETTDGVFEWVATYFNSKTLQIEDRSFDAEMQSFVENVFPQKAIQQDITDRIDSLNEFVAGAGAGLRGISAKDFRRDFSLGERFYSDIETTALLQGGKGFTPGGGTGTFGKSPFQENWSETFKEFYVKPMQDYRMKLEQIEKLRLEGLEGNVTLATGMYEELTKLQEVLKNNQVVFQYRAVLADLTKTFEAQIRAVKENLAVEKSRQELLKSTSGYMKGIAEGLDNLDLGAQKYSELNVKQRAVTSNPEYRALAKELKLLTISKEGTAENVFASDKALVALNSIGAVAKGFGASLSPDQLKNYTETVARTGSTGFAEMTLETSKVVDNTAATVEKLDQILENLGDTADLEGILNKYGQETSPRNMVDALEKVARVREKAEDTGNNELVISSNKALDILSKNLVEQVGVKKAISLVESNFTLFSKQFQPEEMAQRAFGNLDPAALISNLRDALPAEKEWFGLKTVKGQPTFEKDVSQLTALQKENNQEQLVSSKTAIKSAAALAVFETLQKNHTNKTIQKFDEQIKSLERDISTGGEGMAPAAKAETTKKIEVLQQAKAAEQSKAKFHSLVQQMSALTAGSMQFARAIGFSEDGVKKLGAGAVGLYGSMKLASTILGVDMPEAAKKFGEELQNITKAFAAGEKPGFYQAYKTKKAGEEFVRKTKEEGFAAGGLVRGPGGPRDDKILAMVSNGEYIVDADSTAKVGYDKLDYISKYGKLPKYARGGVVGDIIAEKQAEQEYRNITAVIDKKSIGRMTQVITAALASAVSGYGAGKTEEEVRIATLNKKAAEESRAIADLIIKNKEAAQSVYDKLTVKTLPNNAALKVATEEQSLVLDTERERKTVEESLKKMRETFVKEFETIANEAGELQDKLAQLELAEEFKMEMTAMRAEIAKLDVASYMKELNASLTSPDKRNIYNPLDYLFKQRPNTFGLMAGKYSPESVDYGIQKETELTPEQYLVYKAKDIEYAAETLGDHFTNLSDKINYVTKDLDLFDIPKSEVNNIMDWFARLSTFALPSGKDLLAAGGRVFEDKRAAAPGELFKRLEKAQGKNNILLSKIEEYSAERVELEAIKKQTGGLSDVDEKQLDMLNERIESLEDELKDNTEAIKKDKGIARSAIIQATVKQELAKTKEELVSTMVSRGQSRAVSSNISIETALNKSLKGFTGDLATRISSSQFSNQQYMYTSGGSDIRDFYNRVSEMQDAVQNYTSYLDQLNAQRQGLAERLASEEDKGSSTAQALSTSMSLLDDETARVTDNYKELSDAIEGANTALYSMQLIAGASRDFTSAFNTAVTQNMVTGTEKFKAVMDKINSLYGSGNFRAKQAVTPVERLRSAMRGGYPLDEFATGREIEESNLQQRIATGGLRGNDLMEAMFEYATLPEKYATKEKEELYQVSTDQIKAAVEPLIRVKKELSTLYLEPTITEAQRADLDAAMSQLDDLLTNVVSGEGVSFGEARTDALKTYGKDSYMAKSFIEGLDKFKPLGEYVGVLPSQKEEGVKTLNSIMQKFLPEMKEQKEPLLAPTKEIRDSVSDIAGYMKTFVSGPEKEDKERISEVGIEAPTAHSGFQKFAWGLDEQIDKSRLAFEEFLDTPRRTGFVSTITYPFELMNSLIESAGATMAQVITDPLREVSNMVYVAGSATPMESQQRVLKERSANIADLRAQAGQYGTDPTAIEASKEFYKSIQKFTQERQTTVVQDDKVGTTLKSGAVAVGGLALAATGGTMLAPIGAFIAAVAGTTFIISGLSDVIKGVISTGKDAVVYRGDLAKQGFDYVTTVGKIIEDKKLAGEETTLRDIVPSPPTLGQDDKLLVDDEYQSLLKELYKAIETNTAAVDKNTVKNSMRGEVQKKATGGFVSGPGGPKDDKIPALLSNGEYVVKTNSARKIGYDTLNFMNDKGQIPMMAEGGLVSELFNALFGGSTEFSAIRAKKDIGGREKQLEDELKKQLGHAEGGPISNIFDWFFKTGGTEASAVKAGELLGGREKQLEEQLKKQLGHAEGGPISNIFDWFFKTGGTEASAVKAGELLGGREKQLEDELKKQLGHADGSRVSDIEGGYADFEKKLLEARDNARMNYSIAAQKMVNQEAGMPQGLVSTPIESDLSRYDFDIPSSASTRGLTTRMSQGPLARMIATGVAGAKTGKLPNEMIEAYAKNIDYIRKGRKSGHKITGRGAVGQGMAIALDAVKQAEDVLRVQTINPDKIKAFVDDLKSRGVLEGFKKSYGLKGLMSPAGLAPGTTTFPGMVKSMLDNKEWVKMYAGDDGTKSTEDSYQLEKIIKLLQGQSKKEDVPEHKIKLAAGGMIPTMHTGGSVRQDGLHNLQKGEFIFPKRLADGGTVDNALSLTASSSNGEITIDTVSLEEQIDRFEKIVDDMDLTIKNTEPLENLGETITVTAELADNKVYLEDNTVKLDTSTLPDLTGAVGADELADKLETVISSLDDRVSRIREESASDIEMLTGQQEEASDRLYSKLDESIKLEKAVIEKKFNELNSQAKDDADRAARIATAVEQQVNDIKNQINVINTQLYTKA